MRIKLVNEKAQMPLRASMNDAGADCFSPVAVVIPAHSQVFIDLGFQMELPKNTVGYLFARSGLGSKYGVRPRNCVGVIDEKYRGNVGVMLENHSDMDYLVSEGDRICQLVVQPVYHPVFELADNLDETERGAGGFGHTGK